MWQMDTAGKKNAHSIPIDQSEPMFGFRTHKVLNLENPATAAGAHGDIATRGCGEVTSIHVDIDNCGRFDILAAGLRSSS